MTDEIPEPVDWAGLTPEPTLEDIAPPSDVREAFATPDYRAHGRNKRKLFGSRERVKAPGNSRQRTIKSKPDIPNRKGQFVEPVERLYATIGGIIAIRDPQCGRIVVNQSHAAAVALDDLAYTDEFTRRLLWWATQTGKYGAVIGAHAPILFVVLMHHVPAVSEAMGYITQAFAESVVREGQNEQATA